MRTLVLVLVAVFLSAPADAQFRRKKPFAKKGDVALVAGVSGINVLALRPTLNGIGVRYRLADQTVLGTSIGVRIGSNDIELEQEQGQQEQVAMLSSESSGGDLSVWIEQHLGDSRRTFSPFIGGVVSAGYQTNTSESEVVQILECSPDEPCPPFTSVDMSESETQSISGGLFAGAEVRLIRGVTLGGGYSLGARYSRTEGIQTRTGTRFGETRIDTSVQDSNRLDIGTQASQLYLSVYF